jgi:hypothetical protein
MLQRLRHRLTYANVMASIAVFGVLAGGGAYAASKIGPGDIQANAVRSNHIKNGEVKTGDLANGSIGTPKLKLPGMVPPGKTLVGRYGYDYDTDGTGDGGTSISYPIPMPGTLTNRYIDAGGAPTDDCPGTVSNPAAEPGFLCVYAAVRIGSSSGGGFLGSSRFGTSVLATDNGTAGDLYEAGTWAATAPLAPAAAATAAPSDTKK